MAFSSNAKPAEIAKEQLKPACKAYPQSLGIPLLGIVIGLVMEIPPRDRDMAEECRGPSTPPGHSPTNGRPTLRMTRRGSIPRRGVSAQEGHK
jgi:hypothetical protein